MSKRNPQLYVEDILNSIRKVGGYVRGMTLESFRSDEKTVDAVVRNIEIIGEAARNILSGFRAAHPDIPWEKMTAMRNKVAHEYFGVDVEILWQTVQEDLPALEGRMEEVAKTLG